VKTKSIVETLELASTKGFNFLKVGYLMSDFRLFIFGSFDQGFVHYSKIQNFVQSIQVAKVQGTVLRSEVGYPVLMNSGNEWVEGKVVDLAGGDVLVRLLDEFHGFSQLLPDRSLFHRVELEAVVSDGTQLMAQTYVLNPKKLNKTFKAIPRGDWRSNLIEEPPYLSRLSDSEINYIQKLGSASGRDIIPIDIDIYRRLIGSGIVADKGRRLALTKFGRDLLRHLH
jgi:gamma-glutamylcyclotransferase (GGCT)/AIG2-like uncharacterized protein YtfP